MSWVFERNEPSQKSQVRPPKVRFGRRTCMAFGFTFGRRRWSGQPPIKGPQSVERITLAVFFHLLRWDPVLLKLFFMFSFNHAKIWLSFMLFWRFWAFNTKLWILESLKESCFKTPCWDHSSTWFQEVSEDPKLVFMFYGRFMGFMERVAWIG